MSKQIFYRHPKLTGLELRYGDDNRTCYGLHTHNEYSFGAVLDGKAIYQYCNQTYNLQRGNTLLIAPNVPHSCNRTEPTKGDSSKHWSYLMLYIDSDYWQKLNQQFFFQATNSIVNADGKPSHNLEWFRAIVYLHKVWQILPDDALAIETAWLNCFQLLAESETTMSISNEPTSTLKQTLLKQALTWLEYHLTEHFSLSEWANAVGIHRVQLLRLFREQLHISPHQYCLNRRIQQAKTLLKQGVTLHETAYTMGFADQAHFQRTFKRYAAITPRQYQQNR